MLAAFAAIVAEAGADDPSAATPGERYERLEVIAVGGRGRVWRAWDRQMGREVAIKELRPDRPAGRTLAVEVATLTRLGHPNVVPVYDTLPDPADGTTVAYVMRLLPGPTLRQAAVTFHAGRPADGPAFRRLVGAFLEVCRAVAHAHGRDIWHLDLKEDNVRLGPLGEAVVIDWGPDGRGTPGYLAPEQADPTAAVDARTDVCGLGAVLYELLTGR